MSATVLETPQATLDRVKDLPANQGKNDNALWLAYDTERAVVVGQGVNFANVNQTPVSQHGNA